MCQALTFLQRRLSTTGHTKDEASLKVESFRASRTVAFWLTETQATVYFQGAIAEWLEGKCFLN